MPSPRFQVSLPFVLRWEGGFVDHPNDPGGRTNKGITQKVYDAWRVRQGLASRDVLHLEDAEVQVIYESGYWLPPRCDRLPTRLDLVQLDTAVNMGVGRAVRFLQKAVGAAVDGKFGSNTLQAVEARDADVTIAAYCGEREAYYRRLAAQNPKMAVFLKGWLNRLNALRHEVDPSGLESVVPLDFGDAGYIAKVPDFGEDPAFDL